jgi:steroid delta-isomerase-like uncharacterized protein
MPNLTDIAREIISAYNAGNSQQYKKHLSGNIVYDEVGTGRKIQGIDAVTAVWEQWRKTFSDVKGTVANAGNFGNTAILEITWQGTQSGPLDLGGTTHPSSGKRMTTRSTQVLVFDGDKVKECRHYFDMLSMLQQVGAIPTTTRATGA